MTVILAHRLSAGGGVLALALAGLVVLWPVYRRIIRGLGTMFAVYGLALLVVAVAGGGADWGHVTGLLFGGLGLRGVAALPTGLRRRRALGGRRSGQASSVLTG